MINPSVCVVTLKNETSKKSKVIGIYARRDNALINVLEALDNDPLMDKQKYKMSMSVVSDTIVVRLNQEEGEKLTPKFTFTLQMVETEKLHDFSLDAPPQMW